MKKSQSPLELPDQWIRLFVGFFLSSVDNSEFLFYYFFSLRPCQDQELWREERQPGCPGFSQDTWGVLRDHRDGGGSCA